jgi:hypothetical protein
MCKLILFKKINVNDILKFSCVSRCYMIKFRDTYEVFVYSEENVFDMTKIARCKDENA